MTVPYLPAYLAICHHATIHPSIHLSSPHFPSVPVCTRSPVGRTLVLVRLVVRSLALSLSRSLVVGAIEKSQVKIVFPVFHAALLPHFPIFRFSLPVSFRRFSSFRVSTILPYPILVPVPIPEPARAQASGRLLRAGARGSSISLPRWLPQPARIAPISSPRLLVHHARRVICSASSISRFDCTAPATTAAFGPPACQYQHHCSRLPLTASKACSPRRIYVESSSSTPPSISHLVIRHPPHAPHKITAIHVPLSTPHTAALTPYTHNSYRSQLRWSRPSCRSPPRSLPSLALAFPNLSVGGSMPNLTREYTSRALL